MKAKTLSIVVPFRNWGIDVVEVALKSLELQTVPVFEIIIVDVASFDEYKTAVKEVCERYGAKHLYIPIDAPEKAIDVHLWNTCFNHGVRRASGNLVMYSGMDRVYESNMVECVLDYYNWHLQRGGQEGFFCSKVYNLRRTPKLSELENFDALIQEAKWRGGYGYWGSSRKWLHKVRGLDETIRWYEDLDLARRASRDFGRHSILWTSGGTSSGKIRQRLNKHSRVLHLANHPVGRRKHRGADVTAVAQRGKLGLRMNETVVRNDETWGILTPEKLDRALRLVDASPEEVKRIVHV